MEASYYSNRYRICSLFKIALKLFKIREFLPNLVTKYKTEHKTDKMAPKYQQQNMAAFLNFFHRSQQTHRIKKTKIYLCFNFL